MAHHSFYPANFEQRIGYRDIIEIITSYASNKIGKELLNNLHASTEYPVIRHRLDRVREMMTILQEMGDFLSLSISDLRPTLKTLSTEGTYILEEDLSPLLQAIDSYVAILSYLFRKTSDTEGGTLLYPTLARIPAHHEGIAEVGQEIGKLLNHFGKIKDEATPTLWEIRKQQIALVQQISHKMRKLLDDARQKGYIEDEAQPTLREGRPVIPLISSYKKDLPGIVHDESATGKTLFIEPLEVVQLNNRKRELEGEERREIIRILLELSEKIRPIIPNLEKMCLSMGRLDAVYAIARFAIEDGASIPELKPHPRISWYRAIHPLLKRSLAKEKKEVIPIQIHLKSPENRILVISGPNAGGKSVCLKTVGLLQYMLQAGIPISVSPDSTAGVFGSIALDIGDDQSIEDDLSTYSSHLKHMRFMAASSNRNSLILIDEFGGGTEPEIGGAIAEGLLNAFNKSQTFGVITTHYRNLKEFASQNKGIVNGAMLYNPKEMRPLFELSIGQPGSSFAIEIAKKQGIPKEVIDYASQKVGQAVLNSDALVQEIARDKQFWEKKTQEILQREKNLEQTLEVYKLKLERVQREREEILQASHKEAQKILQESRARIENTIRKIVESKAEKESTKKARQELSSFEKALETEMKPERDERIAREIERLRRREERKREKQQKSTEKKLLSASLQKPIEKRELREGDSVEIITQGAKGKIITINGNDIEVLLGDHFRVHCKKSQLRLLSPSEKKGAEPRPTSMSNIVEEIHNKRLHFSQEFDVRGMRLSEAVLAVEYYVDEAISLGVSQVRILHGTGTGALREGIRESLKSISGVQRFFDEDVRFGGAGITIVILG